MKKITVIGSGAMGTACATVLKDNKHSVIIYGVDQNELCDLKTGCNLKYFEKNICIPCFETTNDMQFALKDVDYVVLAVPTKFIDPVMEAILEEINKPVVFINVSKGFWPSSTLSMHEGLELKTKNNPLVRGIVSLIGPSFAIELVQRKITLIDAVSNQLELAKEIQELFSNDYMRVYTQIDVKGAETGAIFKNMLAIGSGMLEALGYSLNTQCAFLTRGLKEMETYNQFVNGNKQTLYGLTGLGDLMLTALSSKSRNYSFGKEFIKNRDINTNITVEGLNSVKLIYEEFIKTKKLDLPIIENLYNILYNKCNIQEAIKSLLKRPLKSE
ncbi:NAD(P)H-dependent glycerol-3-phosphate dehydrogenase [[Mycoplasma] anseris]|uniref:Glycerol-3-phosphate dehydrogenase n=1 Tax=[Mycoplasma] anseris TaxID=92400 RepID=A0A2Z4NC97_9BACT|nr:NAD(P)H-dependent glycerol-3-phosphate dehydrogenase [[Mycoplasma] anseris]AWX69170.1 NAD(P)H-dependent glycerol-3-phosphate dehydrogenase [[Mycoplasma] anseris]